jgi:hypothetical protein
MRVFCFHTIVFLTSRNENSGSLGYPPRVTALGEIRVKWVSNGLQSSWRPLCLGAEPKQELSHPGGRIELQGQNRPDPQMLKLSDHPKQPS